MEAGALMRICQPPNGLLSQVGGTLFCFLKNKTLKRNHKRFEGDGIQRRRIQTQPFLLCDVQYKPRQSPEPPLPRVFSQYSRRASVPFSKYSIQLMSIIIWTDCSHFLYSLIKVQVWMFWAAGALGLL